MSMYSKPMTMMMPPLPMSNVLLSITMSKWTTILMQSSSYPLHIQRKQRKT